MSWLPRADKEQRGAFIVSPLRWMLAYGPPFPRGNGARSGVAPSHNRTLANHGSLQRDERVLVVWAYTFDDIIPTVRDFEEKLIRFIVAQRNTLGYGAFAPMSASPSAVGSAVNLASPNPDGIVEITEKAVGDAAQASKEKEQAAKDKKAKNKNKKSRSCLSQSFGYFVSSKDDVEKTADGPSARPIRLLAPFYSGVAVALSICKLLLLCDVLRPAHGSFHSSVFVGSGVSTLITEVVLDDSFLRFALLATAPFLFCVSLVRHPVPDTRKILTLYSQFFSMQIIADVGMMYVSALFNADQGMSLLTRMCSFAASALSHSSTRTRSTTLPSRRHRTRSWIQISRT